MSPEPVAAASALPDPVGIWLMSPESLTPAMRRHALALLGAAERARHERYRVDAARDQYLVGRLMLRTMLSRYAAVPPEQWVFAANDHGRPRIEAPRLSRPLHFNLSHTHGLVALAMGASEAIGVDVENVGRSVSLDDLAANYYSAKEQALLASTAPEQRRRVFFDIWTLREAYAKARGLGLALPLDRYGFCLDGDRIQLDGDLVCDDDAQRWRFWRLYPTADHVVAVAVAPDVFTAEAGPALHWFDGAGA